MLWCVLLCCVCESVCVCVCIQSIGGATSSNHSRTVSGRDAVNRTNSCPSVAPSAHARAWRAAALIKARHHSRATGLCAIASWIPLAWSSELLFQAICQNEWLWWVWRAHMFIIFSASLGLIPANGLIAAAIISMSLLLMSLKMKFGWRVRRPMCKCT